MKNLKELSNLLCDITCYSIIVLFIALTISTCCCCISLLYPHNKLEEYSVFITAIVAVFAFIVAWGEYKSRIVSMKAKVFSEYNKRYSEDPNIVKVVKYLNYIDVNGTTNNPHREKPSNYEVEMFMRFFEELELQISNNRLNEQDVLDLFVYYAKIIDENEELRRNLGITDYEENWKKYKSLIGRKKIS